MLLGCFFFLSTVGMEIFDVKYFRISSATRLRNRGIDYLEDVHSG